MELYLLRHAEAVDRAPTDRDRGLTAKGEAQAARAAKFCHHHRLALELILSSPFLRAAQTARPVAERLGVELVEAPFLEPGLEPEQALAELSAYRKFERIMVVGHEPDLSTLIAHLLRLATPEALHLRKGALVCLQLEHFRRGSAVLEWFIPPELLP